MSAVRTIGVPPGQVEAPAYTLVNLETTFYSEPETIDRTLSIIGYSVEVRIEPTSFAWHWGDGTSTTSDSPGRPYPATDITHRYDRATRGQPLGLSVDVTYTATYRVDGGDWLAVPDPLVIPGPTTNLPIRQASAVIVE